MDKVIGREEIRVDTPAWDKGTHREEIMGGGDDSQRQNSSRNALEMRRRTEGTKKKNIVISGIQLTGGEEQEKLEEWCNRNLETQASFVGVWKVGGMQDMYGVKCETGRQNK